ncbi:RagB/SusD family nutrient uptake outer membrane protein [Mucilaginibacter sp. PAMB04168]|uniref:RagB/SusD family nutrient uptake outer membrane protein n=1 Tax=Mucilaginibacter sp. PAMB04168 TaxID=3138567 RepID=UPI0031F6C6AC
MKNIYLILLAVLIISGCKKYQQDGPLENLTEDLVFDPQDKNGYYAEQYLNNLYSSLPNGFNRIGGDFLDAATDDALPSRDGTDIENVSQARISSVISNPDGYWNNGYTTIRKVNVFLQKIDVVPVAARIPGWKAEVRFLRAMAYFELLKRYGGIPLVGDQVFSDADNLNIKRSTFAACVDYIVNECDAIKTLVKQEPLSATDWGHASRGAVLALKSRVLLYAASPLFNGGVAAGATAEQREVMGYANFDAERWNKAAQAALELINLPGKPYSLPAPASKSFSAIFLDRKNSEIILDYLRDVNYDIEYNNGPIGFSNQATGLGRTSPTQDLVDAFPTLAGRAIAETGSGYQSQAPYANRDPRLAFTVLANDVTWLNRKLEMFEGGLDKPNKGGRVQTKTGYYLRKFMGNFTTATSYANGPRNFIIFRYAEILLNFAEAQNEYLSTPSADIYNALRDLRRRAQITEGTTNKFGIKDNMTKAEMRDAIKNERRLELAFEEHRYWDLRRWKDAERVLNQNLSGMQIIKNANSTFTYTKVPVGQVRFAFPKMYLYPVPFAEISKSSNLIQNFGW